MINHETKNISGKALSGICQFVLFACLLGSATTEVLAQAGALEEIVVTARKREESLQDTPLSVAAFTAADLEERGAVDFSDLGEFTPNVTFDFTAPIAAGNSAAIVMIRGVGSADWALPVDPGVGIYLDGVYIARTIGQVMDTVDVERIEVLRGPQGTLFGRNTIGGAISVVTKKPTTDRVFGRAEVTTGSYDRIDVNGYLNVPLGETLAGSLSVSSRNRDGYVKNLGDGPDLGDNEDVSGRVAFRWTPADTMTLDVTADYSVTDENPAPNVLIDVAEDGFFPKLNNLVSGDPACGGFVVSTDPARFGNDKCYNDQWVSGPHKTWSSHLSATPELQNNDRYGVAVRPDSELTVWGIGGTLEWDITDNLTVKSITAHRRVEDGFWSRDTSHSKLPVHVIVRTANDYEQKQTTQELQLLGTAFDDRLEWLIGGYYLKETGKHLDVVELPFNTVFDSGGTIDNESKAVFAQGTFDVTSQISLTAGVRYTDEEKEFVADSHVGQDAGIPFPLSISPASPFDCRGVPLTPANTEGSCVLPTDPAYSNASEVQPYVNLSFRWTDDLMTYASYSEGFKAGAFTQRVFPAKREAPVAGPEFVKVYEGGFKSTLMDNRVRFNGAVFFTDYTDMQVTSDESDSAGTIGLSTVNAAEAEILGFELEMTAAPTPAALLQVGVGYLDAEYVKLDEGVQFDIDDDLINAPEWNINVAAQYEYSLGTMGSLTPRLDLSHTSKVANDDRNTPLLMQPAYTLVNLSLTWRDVNDVWSLTAAGRNVADETYIITGFANNNGVEGVYGMPATWSLSLRRNFN
ncbi:MAG: TonB-dependent receptor [Gammaproteobacteria bacterium]|nr:TonB-dependent receptor [Gammaproteobacteria bacterium]